VTVLAPSTSVGGTAREPRRLAAPPPDVGVGVIVVYKATKALAELALVVGLVAMARGHRGRDGG
jgi:hypothetical protein